MSFFGDKARWAAQPEVQKEFHGKEEERHHHETYRGCQAEVVAIRAHVKQKFTKYKAALANLYVEEFAAELVVQKKMEGTPEESDQKLQLQTWCARCLCTQTQVRRIWLHAARHKKTENTVKPNRDSESKKFSTSPNVQCRRIWLQCGL